MNLAFPFFSIIKNYHGLVMGILGMDYNQVTKLDNQVMEDNLAIKVDIRVVMEDMVDILVIMGGNLVIKGFKGDILVIMEDNLVIMEDSLVIMEGILDNPSLVLSFSLMEGKDNLVVHSFIVKNILFYIYDFLFIRKKIPIKYDNSILYIASKTSNYREGSNVKIFVSCKY